MDTFYKQTCAACGSEWTSGKAASACNNCRVTALFAQLPPDVVAQADEKIFERKTLPSIRIYWDITSSLADARDLHDWRYNYLKEYFTEKFRPE